MEYMDIFSQFFGGGEGQGDGSLMSMFGGQGEQGGQGGSLNEDEYSKIDDADRARRANAEAATEAKQWDIGQSAGGITGALPMDQHTAQSAMGLLFPNYNKPNQRRDPMMQSQLPYAHQYLQGLLGGGR